MNDLQEPSRCDLKWHKPFIIYTYIGIPPRILGAVVTLQV